MQWWIMVLAVSVGGAFGAVGRFGIQQAVRHWTSWPEHVGTAVVNLAGCFGIGVAYAFLLDADGPPWHRAALVTGLLGAFTTFSTFSLDAMTLIHDGKLAQLAAYVAGSVVMGVVAVKAGMHLAAALLH